MPTIFVEDELRQLVPFDLTTLEAVEQAFCWISDDQVRMPPVATFPVSGDNIIDVRGALVHGLDSFAIKLASGFFDNPQRGLPSCTSLLTLFSAETGAPMALFLDNGYLESVRTAMAGAIAAKYLAPRHVHTAGVIGVGAQARYQLRALMLVRPFARLLVYGRRADRVEQYAAEMAELLGVEVVIANSPAEVAAASQCVVTTTPATSPLLLEDVARPGLHITAMGADMAGKRELDPALLRQADRIFCDVPAQSRAIGELQGVADLPAPTELGEVILGRASGRRTDEEFTICDLTGTGAQDTCIARLAWSKAQGTGHGTLYPYRGFPESSSGVENEKN